MGNSSKTVTILQRYKFEGDLLDTFLLELYKIEDYYHIEVDYGFTIKFGSFPIPVFMLLPGQKAKSEFLTEPNTLYYIDVNCIYGDTYIGFSTVEIGDLTHDNTSVYKARFSNSNHKHCSIDSLWMDILNFFNSVGNGYFTVKGTVDKKLIFQSSSNKKLVI